MCVCVLWLLSLSLSLSLTSDLDVDEIKSEEEMVMLADAKKLRLDSSLEPIISPGGATPLHIAAAKEYTTVLK